MILSRGNIIAVNPGMIHGLGADAKGATNLNLNITGERAEARASFLKQVVQAPVEYYKSVWSILLKSATGVTWYELGKKTVPEIKETLKQNPQMESALDNAMQTVKSGVTYLSDTGSGYLTLIKYAPYILVAGLVTIAIFAFRNPGAVTPTIKLQR